VSRTPYETFCFGNLYALSIKVYLLCFVSNWYYYFQNIEEFLSDAKEGAIYVSFGSNLKLSTLSPHMLQSFLEAFKAIPQKVLMKWELDEYPVGNDNILFQKWLPQLDILCEYKPYSSGVHWLSDMIGNTDQNNQV
jgi:hypothetical protein